MKTPDYKTLLYMQGLGAPVDELIQARQYKAVKRNYLKNHFKGYKEDEGTFRKIGNYLSRPEYKFQSKHTNAGALYWVMRKV